MKLHHANYIMQCDYLAQMISSFFYILFLNENKIFKYLASTFNFLIKSFWQMCYTKK